MNLKVSPGHDYYIRYVLDQGISVMAIDVSKENQIVGLRGHRVIKRGEKSQYQPPKDELWERFMALNDFAFDRVDVWNKYEIESMVECKFLTVDREYRGRGISGKMMEFTFDYMRREKVPLIYCWATSYYTKVVMTKLGFTVVDEMLYEDYKVNGKQVFCPAEVHKGYTILIKMVEWGESCSCCQSVSV